MSSGSTGATRGRDWVAEYRTLTDRARNSRLSGPELERLAVAAFLIGRDDDVTDLRERAIEGYLADGEIDNAARCAFWLGFHLDNAGRHAMAAGWLAKFERLVAQDPQRSAALLGLRDLGHAGHLMYEGRFAEALPLFEVSRDSARRHQEIDALALSGSGIAAWEMLGRPQQAIAMYDEVMVDLVSGPVAPQVVGLVYCSMVAMCMRHLDIGRAREWTQALGRWCDEQSGLVPYRGACALDRAELLQIQGSWQQAEAIVQEATSRPRNDAVDGLAHYRLAEIFRLRGRLDDADGEYRAAARHGVEVQPGLARLRAAQGKLAVAQAGLDRVATEGAPHAMPAVAAARVEVALMRDDLETARQALGALTDLAAADGASPYLRALAGRAAGSVLLAEGEPGPAAARLRRDAAAWADLDAPYEAARTRVLLADACDALGDLDAAASEREAAREIFDRLGATIDLTTIGTGHRDSAGLSPREVQVLRLLATGASNRAIAENLTLSEKTVARHLSNIFGKLGVASRSAATAYAFRHNLA